jgi:serine/threonine protein kinase
LCRFCNGGSLADALSAGLFASARMPSRWRLIVHVLMGISRGMAHMHGKRITHGDLNPANVLFKARTPASTQSAVDPGALVLRRRLVWERAHECNAEQSSARGVLEGTARCDRSWCRAAH